MSSDHTWPCNMVWVSTTLMGSASIAQVGLGCWTTIYVRIMEELSKSKMSWKLSSHHSYPLHTKDSKTHSITPELISSNYPSWTILKKHLYTYISQSLWHSLTPELIQPTIILSHIPIFWCFKALWTMLILGQSHSSLPFSQQARSARCSTSTGAISSRVFPYSW